jgi:hypothetical protein
MPASEVRARVLTTARTMITETGLTVSFDHLPMEEYIKAADVPRSSAYRIWNTRSDLVADLMVELFNEEHPTSGFDPAIAESVLAVRDQHAELLATPAGRLAVLDEAIRIGASAIFGKLSSSPLWPSYAALVAALGSIPPWRRSPGWRASSEPRPRRSTPRSSRCST